MSKPNFKGKEVSREFSIGEVDTDKRTVSISFSSEAEVPRWGYIEVLEHEPDSVDLSRLNDSGPFLFNHNRDQYLGAIVPGSAEIEKDRVGRCAVRFSGNDFADSIFRDVQEGILSKSSVTYRIHEYREEHKDGKDYLIVTRWEPLEVSLVTVPADSSVGVGRSAENTNPPSKTMNEDEIAPEEPGGVAVAERSDAPPSQPQQQSRSHQAGGSDPRKQRETGERSERERASEILKLGRRFNMAERAEQAVDEGLPFELFKSEVLKTVEQRSAKMSQASEDIGLSKREVQSFRFLKLMRHAAMPQSKRFREEAAFELEACRAAAEKYRSRADEEGEGGLKIPLDVLRSPLVDSRAANTVSIKAGAGYTGTGGNLVDTTLLTSSFVELLKNRTVFLQLARSIGGLVGDIEIPKQLTGPAGYWIGEDEDAMQDDITFGQLAMTPKTVATYGEITRKFLKQSSIDVEALFRSELIAGLAQTINLAGFYGDGTGNQPVGIKETLGVNAVNFVGNDPTFAELVQMETEVAADNASTDSTAYVSNTRFRGYAKSNLKFAGVAGTIWEPGNTVNGTRTEITNSIANGDVFYGNFFEALLGMWGGLDLTVDPFTHSAKGRIRIVAMQDIDILCRRPESFTYGANIA